MPEFLVLSSSSSGYHLLSLDGKEEVLSKKRGKVGYKEKAIWIGDVVSLDEHGFIKDVKERTSALSRPRLANADRVDVVLSLKKPDFSFFLLDKFLTLLDRSGLPATIVVNKCDLATEAELSSFKEKMGYYERLGYTVYYISALDGSAMDFMKLQESLEGKKTAFMGQTGVGKSTLLNALDPTLERKVDALYPTVNRGRHTTKETVLVPYGSGFLYDTPGFSDFRLPDMTKEELAMYFPGFLSYYGNCLFKDCNHHEGSKGCAVLQAVRDKTIPEESYKDYLKIYEEVLSCRWKK